MKITLKEFAPLIKEFPIRKHSFDIKRKNWVVNNQDHIVEKIFDDKAVITLTRYDLINSSFDMDEFVIKVLMWGYPTKGRGKNIEKILEPGNFKSLVDMLMKYREDDISIDQLIEGIKKIKGLGLSTMTKFTNFLNISINGHKAVIFDARIIDTLNSSRFEELKSLTGINYHNKSKRYLDYTKVLDHLSKQLGVESEQIEMFLFMFGKNLSEVLGENCYEYD
jgi:cell division protein FtsI/penicillin-binding protein 2